MFKRKWRGGCPPARGSPRGQDEIFWQYFRYYCHPVGDTCCCCGAPAATVRCWCPLSLPPAFPATRIPLAQKGEEIPTTRFPSRPKTIGVKGSGFLSPHVDASRPHGTARPPPAAGGTLAPSAALQPSRGEHSPGDSRLPHR